MTFTDCAPELQAEKTCFATIQDKVHAGARLTPSDGLYLMHYPDLHAVEQLADRRRQALVGDTVYFATTHYIHPTNLCELSCPMCSYYAKPGMAKAWFHTPDQIEQKIREALLRQPFKEVHIVGGLWRDCNLDYYQDLFTRILSIDEQLHIKALTPVEYDFLAQLHGISVEEVLSRMRSWGLGSLPGGGAEILVERVRRQVAPQKIDSDRYLEIHRIAHRLGIRSNMTMLFGHVEEAADIVTHLCRVRELQDETGGLQTFIPLRYHEENNALGKRKQRIKPKEVGRIYALSRLMLDNVRNLKVLWNYTGIDAAASILACGANDFSSTNTEERIIQMAGGVRFEMTRERIIDIIRGLGRQPKEIHSGHDYAADPIIQAAAS